MKIVINKCFGGFGLSPKAILRVAEIQGRECYFFSGYKDKELVPVEECKGLFWSAYDTQDLSFEMYEKPWCEMSREERDSHNKEYESHQIPNFRDDRTNPILLQVVEELGVESSGSCADLAVVEIPDGLEYTIEEYDGLEHIAESHRTWG